MAEPKQITTGGPDDYSAIQVTYTKRRKSIRLFAWHGSVGIEPEEMPLMEFCERLGISRRDLPE